MKIRARHFDKSQPAFTLVEIAISLAVIGIALVGIIGVLPLGMREQRANREQTVINQDATVFIQAIHSGAQGLDDLTNYVFAIVNERSSNPLGYTNALAASMGFSLSQYPGVSWNPMPAGSNVVGLLTTPEFTDSFLHPTNNPFYTTYDGYSNHIIAYVRSISGPAVEKPPQTNSILQQDAFSYRIYCVNAPVATDTNIFSLPASQRGYTDQLAANLHELRLTFLWPILPNGGIGTGHQTYRVTVPGQIVQDPANNSLYFYQSQSFTNAL